MKQITIYLLLFISLFQQLRAQNTMESPINVGTKSFSFIYSNTQNTAGYTNNYGRSSSDVFYKFILSRPMEVTISHCGSELSDTYLYLLDASGSLISSNDDYSGEGHCASTYNSYIRQQLAAGTYLCRFRRIQPKREYYHEHSRKRRHGSDCHSG